MYLLEVCRVCVESGWILRIVFEFESDDTWYEACVLVEFGAELDWQS